MGAEDIRIYEGILRAPSYTLTFTPERGGERIYGKMRVMVFSEPQLPYTLTFTPERGGERIYGKIRMTVFSEPQLHSDIHARQRRRAYSIYGKKIKEKILYACT